MDTKTMNRLGNYMYVPHSSPNITAAKLIIVSLQEFARAMMNAETEGATRNEIQGILVPTHILPIELTLSIPQWDLLRIKEIAELCLRQIQIGSYGSNKLCNIIMECAKFHNSKSGEFRL